MTSGLIQPSPDASAVSVAMHPSLAFFVVDHETLQPALAALTEAVNTLTLPSGALLQHLYDHMAEHFGLEETVLFPAVPFTPSAVLLMAEHDQLWQLWHAMANACNTARESIQTANPETDWPEAINAYLLLMQSHIHEENACLLPSCDRDMTAAQKLTLAKALQHAQSRTDWVPRPIRPKTARRLQGPSQTNKITCRIQPDCRLEWYTMPEATMLKPHVSPHQRTLMVLSGQVNVSTPDWSGVLNTGEGLEIDAVLQISINAERLSQLVMINARSSL